MKLKTVYVRFYKSFNFDYLRKFHPKAKQKPWEIVDGSLWYPFVRVQIEPSITTIVGANESGKSHLLSAIEKGISGNAIAHEDFCRYSQFFNVKKLRHPDFGFEWSDLLPNEVSSLSAHCKPPLADGTNACWIFRSNNSELTVYTQSGSEYTKHQVNDSKAVSALLPRPFRIDAEVALPDSVPIKALIDAELPVVGLASVGRADRFNLLDDVWENHAWFESKDVVAQHALEIATSFGAHSKGVATIANARDSRQIGLARDLICRIAKIEPKALEELYSALRRGKEGYANGIVQKINDGLAASLNFPKWWGQDRAFSLLVSPREFDLVFTIKDRTGTEYSFTERSSGLKYFLSYYIQYLAHTPQAPCEILLMDEPDAYLSSQAQQDLLRIFEAFATGQDGRRPVQVAYVTHSPFLIDKNHAERVRVLEKGSGEEGTRVVHDAAKNHYEPLRSAFGAFVAETTFIGNCNLMVEGSSDQVLLAGATAILRTQGAATIETLDLNQVTIVPAGSAGHVPYMVYLARGRDVEKPAVVVLLDSDPSGNEAVSNLRKLKSAKLPPEYIIQIGGLNSALLRQSTDQPLLETEDLIPFELCAIAARAYLHEFCGIEVEESNLNAELIKKSLHELTTAAEAAGEKKKPSTFDGIEDVVGRIGDGIHIEKLGFARNVIRFSSKNKSDPSVADFLANMKTLFKRLGDCQRRAVRDLTTDKVSKRIERAKDKFARDYPSAATREQALVFCEEIAAVLSQDDESDAVDVAVKKMKRDFELETDVTKPVANYESFREAIEKLKYVGLMNSQGGDLLVDGK